MYETGSERNDTARQSKLLRTLGQLLAIQATESKPALDAVSNLVSEALEADKVDTFLYDSSANMLVAVGSSQQPMSRLQHELGLHLLQLANGGRAAEVFQTGIAYHNGQVQDDPGELLGVREGLGVCSQMYVPLEVGGARRGVLGVSSARREAFLAEDLLFLQAVAHWVGMVVQRVELFERLTREVAEEARQLTAEQLITVLAHDIGNYLTPLLGRVFMLRSRAERDSRHLDMRDLDATQRSLERTQRLIVDLMDVSRIERGLFILSRQSVDLVVLAREAVDVLQTPEFQVTLNAPDELFAEVDPDRIQQALENLLSNARKHSPSGTPVTVTIAQEQRADGDWAVLSVADSGPGIPPEMFAQIFERFVTGARSKGLGIGLYLTQRIAHAHGGSVMVESTAGVGTTFRLMLPLVQLG